MKKLLILFKSIYDCNLQSASIFLLTISYFRFLMSAVFINEFGYQSLSESLPIKYRVIILSTIALSSILYAVTLSGAIMKKTTWLKFYLNCCAIALSIFFIVVVNVCIETLTSDVLSPSVLKLSVTVTLVFHSVCVFVTYMYYKELKETEKKQQIKYQLSNITDKKSQI